MKAIFTIAVVGSLAVGGCGGDFVSTTKWVPTSQVVTEAARAAIAQGPVRGCFSDKWPCVQAVNVTNGQVTIKPYVEQFPAQVLKDSGRVFPSPICEAAERGGQQDNHLRCGQIKVR